MVRTTSDMRNLPRTVIAFVLFAVLTAGSIGIVGFATADDAPMPGEPVEVSTLELPAPRSGDRWTYAPFDLDTGLPYPEKTHPRVHMGWLAPDVVFDSDGIGWNANLLARVTEENGTVTERVLAVRPGDGVVFEDGFSVSDESEADWLLTRGEFGLEVALGRPIRDPVPLCELVPHRLGAIDLPQGFVLPACHGSVLSSSGPARFRAVGAYRSGEHEYVVFDDVKARPGATERIVYRTDLPMPTLVVERRYDGTRSALLLTHFENGTAPLATLQRPVAEMPRLDFVPLRPWGLDDTGVDHPYPLSQAWEDHRTGSEGEGMRAFLRRNPDAQAHDMGYMHHETERGHLHEWQWALTAADDDAVFCQSYEEPKGIYKISPEATGLVVSQSSGCHTDTTPSVPLDRATGPTVKSLQEAWRVFARARGLPEGPITWTIDHDGRGGAGPAFGVGIAYWIDGETPDPTGIAQPGPSHFGGTTVWFDTEGRLVQWVGTEATLTRSLATGTGEGREVDMSSAAPVAPVPVWAFPDLYDAALLTLLGAFLALLYWAFPWLKHGIFAGMFSRVTKDAALDHEARAAVMAAAEAEPGIHDRELQRRTGLARGQLRHHLDKLVDTGLLTRQRAGRFTGYWPAGQADRHAAERAAAQRAPVATEILALLRDDPHLSATELAARLGRSRQSVAYHLKRLRTAGLLPE